MWIDQTWKPVLPLDGGSTSLDIYSYISAPLAMSQMITGFIY